MNYELIIVFPDTNNAVMGERSLISAGIPVSVMPLPESIAKGCGITLRVGSDFIDKALDVIKSNGISVFATYTRIKTSAGYVYEARAGTLANRSLDHLKTISTLSNEENGDKELSVE
jgi:hypothetical protein